MVRKLYRLTWWHLRGRARQNDGESGPHFSVTIVQSPSSEVFIFRSELRNQANAVTLNLCLSADGYIFLRFRRRLEVNPQETESCFVKSFRCFRLRMWIRIVTKWSRVSEGNFHEKLVVISVDVTLVVSLSPSVFIISPTTKFACCSRWSNLAISIVFLVFGS